MKIKKLFYLISFITVITMMVSCEKDNIIDDEMKPTGQVRFEITDAPIDDSSVEGVFVSITEVKVDGKSVEGFNKTTIDLLAYQNGDTKLLNDSELEAKSYSEVTLVLDYDEDENGESPGCYVMEMDESKKHPLSSSSNEINMNHDFEVKENESAEFVLDFDLRKCIKRQDDTSDKYEFVTASELEAGVRMVSKNNVGMIEGNCDDSNPLVSSDKMVVYVYHKGEFDAEQESQGSGSSNIQFSKAVTSASIDENGDFELHFLEEGDYELHFCSYEEDENGKMQLQGTLIVDVLGSLDLGAISLNSSSSITANVVVLGILPL